jgi:hypothetical protein
MPQEPFTARRTAGSGGAGLEQALMGTSQQIVNVIDSDGWSNEAGRNVLLADLRKRLDETSQLIAEWLDSLESEGTS